MLNSLIIFAAKYLYLFAVGIYAVYFFSISNSRKKGLAILTIVALPCIYLVSKAAAHVYFDPRPFVVNNFVPLIPHAADNGFPSDHTLLTGAIASVVWLYNKKISAILWLIALIVGTSRVLAGIHHPVDIVGAIVISIIITAVINVTLKRQKIIL